MYKIVQDGEFYDVVDSAGIVARSYKSLSQAVELANHQNHLWQLRLNRKATDIAIEQLADGNG